MWDHSPSGRPKLKDRKDGQSRKNSVGYRSSTVHNLHDGRNISFFEGTYMKSGTYRVSFDVTLNNCEDEQDALENLVQMLDGMINIGTFPEVNFDLLEENDIEYNTEEDEVQELNF